MQNPSQTQRQSQINRQLEIISLNPHLESIPSSTKSCINHVEEKSQYYNPASNSSLCLNCATIQTLLDKNIPTSSNLTENEYRKKTKSDEFLQRLEYFQVCLNGYLERNERILHENIQRHRQDISQINLFFEQINSIFIEVYNKLLGEKSQKIEKIKKEHQDKKFHLMENMTDIQKSEADVLGNYEKIVLFMETSSFEGIMLEYKEKLDGVQEICEKKNLDKYSNYEEIRHNAGKIEEANKCIQECVTAIYEAFEERRNIGGYDEDGDGYETETEGKEAGNDNRNSLVLREEMNRINECFYSGGGIGSGRGVEHGKV